MTYAYENVPQRIGNAERDAAVERLRANLDEGRLDQATYETRVATALTATTQDDLDPLFLDLPPVVSSNPTYELYPHQTMATTPAPYQQTEQASQAAQPQQSPMGWFTRLPTWARILLVVMLVALVMGLFRGGGWWIAIVIAVVIANRRNGNGGRYRGPRR